MAMNDYLIYSNGGYREFMGPSGVDKPTTNFFCGIWTESNTGDVYFFDNVNGWTKMFSFLDDAAGSRGIANLIKATRMMVTNIPEEEPAEDEPKEEEPEEAAQR